MSRFNPTRSSFMSRNSSVSNSNRMDTDSINNELANHSLGGEEPDQISNEGAGDDQLQQSFNRNNSFRKSSLRRHSKRSGQFQRPASEVVSDGANGQIHIAPLPPFLNGNPFLDDQEPQSGNTSTGTGADLNAQQQRSYQVLSSIILEESPSTFSSTPAKGTNKKEGLLNFF